MESKEFNDTREIEVDSSDIGLTKESIGYLSITYFGFTLQAAWEAAGLAIQFSLVSGGPASLVYGSLLVGIGTTLIALSLSEMASIDPVVGAQYRWSAQFAPAWPRFWGLFQGWITVFAWMTTTAASLAYMAQGVQALAMLNYPEYIPQAWQATLLMWAFIVPPVVANLWFGYIINPLEWVGAIGHGVYWIASMITLGAMATKSSHSFVWGTLTHDVGGWEQPGIAFGIGLLPLAFPMTSFDGIIHMSKEVKNPKRNVPHSMMFSVVLNAFMMFVWLVVVLYCFGDPDVVAAAPLGMALIGIYMSATGSRGATTLLVALHIFTLFISLFNIVASSARLTWAFSQNNGLPFSLFFAHISNYFVQPVRCLVLVSVVCCLLSLIYIGSTTAFNAFISLPLVALYISYGIPIAFLLFRRVRGQLPIFGPFSLGSTLGLVVNAAAVAYILYVLCFAALPTILPTTAENMNYAGPLILAVMIGAIVDWFVAGRLRFRITEVTDIW
ncbi:amino acid transporter [Thozetella sp. PMI_491]|nr:amino acid transporter [Thozetella sp. PMI_491]